ncbi:MAG TPA: STAS domain-containing protein [Gaiellales bacterium]|nr:STAS domain-containing protein [Gaiellales bacterium]
MTVQEPAFSVEQVQQGDDVVLVVTGGVDMATVAVFEQALAEAMSRTGGDVGLDLSAVTFLGSEGVRALIAAQAAPSASGRSIRIVAASPIARRVLEITGLA